MRYTRRTRSNAYGCPPTAQRLAGYCLPIEVAESTHKECVDGGTGQADEAKAEVRQADEVVAAVRVGERRLPALPAHWKEPMQASMLRNMEDGPMEAALPLLSWGGKSGPSLESAAKAFGVRVREEGGQKRRTRAKVQEELLAAVRFDAFAHHMGMHLLSK